jgi:hypothetical protein
VLVVQMTVDQVVGVVTVRHGLVPTPRAVPMIVSVTMAIVVRRAGRRVAPSHGESVLVDMAVMHMVQMTIVQIVGVPVVLHRGVSAA